MCQEMTKLQFYKGNKMVISRSLGVIKGSLGPLKMNCVEEMIDINLDYPISTV